MKTQTDLYEAVTAEIIEAIEAGIPKFEMPWHTMSTIPTNANTGRRYSGVNVVVLWSLAAKYGYASQLWATYQQWREVGAQVQKNQKSATVVFWKFVDARRQGEAEETSAEPDSNDNTRCFARAYHVFNADQVDGFRIPLIAEIPECERIKKRRTVLPQHRCASSRRRLPRLLRLQQ